MAIMFDYRTQFLIAFMILLLLLLMIPVRAETAEAGIETHITREAEIVTDNAHSKGSYMGFISEKVHIPSFTRKNQQGSILDAVLKISGLHIHSYIPDALPAQAGQTQETDTFSFENISTRIRPLVEISYSLSNRIALEMWGHLNRYTGKIRGSSAGDDEHYGYTLFVGPSLYAGIPGDSSRLYTQFGLGYNVIDSGRDFFSKDCPTSFGTGFSFGYKKKRSDIRIGYNYFREFSDTSSHTGLEKKLDPSSVFLFVTYNFDT